MKKENKKKAKLRREEIQKKKEQRSLVLRIIGIVAAVAFLGVLTWAIVVEVQKEIKTNTTTSTSSSGNSSNNSTQEDTTTTELNTDTSLVVENGDKINLDYVGSIDGVEFQGGNTNGAGTDLVIGSKKYIDDFEEQLIGHKVGDTFDITVTFPGNYGEGKTVDGETISMNNQEAVFSITINGIYK